MNSFFQSSKIRWSLLTLLSTVVLFISLFGALSVSAQSSVEDDFNNFDEVYEEKAKICAKSALIQLIIQAVLSMAGTQVPTVDWPRAIKETVQDCLIWAFKAALIETLSMGTVQYVQTGFDGNPAFVQNIGDYLREIGNGVAGNYIEETVPFLCSPFQLQIKLALTNVYRQSQGLGYNPSCTLSDAVENIQGYLDGDFASGGWNGWYEFTSNPYNNPLGALMEGSQQLGLRVSTQQGTAQVKLNLGSGFFGKEQTTCLVYPKGEDVTTPPVEITLLTPQEPVPEALKRLGFDVLVFGRSECKEKIITPGETIKSNLEQAFQTNLDNIVSADELNEIINLAIGYITYHVLVGEGGLAGYKSEDFEYTGDYEAGVDPIIDPDLPPVQSSCGVGGWLRSNAETPGNPIRFERNGFVFEPQDGNGEMEFEIPGVREGEYYQTMTMSVDVEVGTTSPEINEPNDVYQMMYVRRAERWQENAIGMLNIQPNRGRFIAEHNMNIEIGDCTKADATNFTFVQGERYNLSYTYDTIAGRVTSTVRNAGGQIVAQTSDTPTADMIQTSHPRGGGAGFTVVLGGPNNGHEVTPAGWKFSNLKVAFEAPNPIDPNDDGGGDDEEGDYRVFLDVRNGVQELYAENNSTGAVNRLSRTFPYDYDVADFVVSHNGRRVAYTVKNRTDDNRPLTLYSVPITGGDSAQISNTPDNFDVIRFQFSPDDQYLVYQSKVTTTLDGFIYSAQSTTGQGNRRISSSDEERLDTGFVISCNSRTVYYRNHHTNPDLQKAYSVPIGGGTSTQLPTYELPVIDCEGGGGGDEEEVARIFIDDLGTPNKNELYSESTSGVVTKISQALDADGDVFRFERTADGTRVVYLADVQNDSAELFVVPSAGGAVTRISSPSTVFDGGTSSDVIRFAVSPNGQHVVYAADPNEWTKYELYSVPITGGAVARISHQIPFDYDVDDFKFSPNSQRVVYRAGRTAIGLWELYSTPSGNAGAVRISQDMDTGQNVPQNGFEVSCNSATTYFLADLVGGAAPTLYSVPTTGGTITDVGGGQLPGNICS